jgi:hypothetical protein
MNMEKYALWRPRCDDVQADLTAVLARDVQRRCVARSWSCGDRALAESEPSACFSEIRKDRQSRELASKGFVARLCLRGYRSRLEQGLD